jgi:hypothetical protein
VAVKTGKQAYCNRDNPPKSASGGGMQYKHPNGEYFFQHEKRCKLSRFDSAPRAVVHRNSTMVSGAIAYAHPSPTKEIQKEKMDIHDLKRAEKTRFVPKNCFNLLLRKQTKCAKWVASEKRHRRSVQR